MTNRRLSFQRGLVPLSIALVAAACGAPTPVIRQPYSSGGGSGDGGFGTGGTGAVPGGELPGGMGGSTGLPGSGTGGATGAGGASGASGAADGGASDGNAGGSQGRGGAMGAGGVMGMGGRTGSGGAGGMAMPDAGRMDMGPMGAGGMMMPPPPMDAPIESSSIDVSPPPPPMDTGLPPGAACMKSGWTVEASRLCTSGQCLVMMASRKEPRYAVDGDIDTRYTSGIPQGSMGAETVTVSFPGPITITGVTITSQVGDGAAAYRIESSADGRTFSAFAPPLEGTGSDNIVVSFAAKTMRALRITQTGMKSVPWWSIHEISVAGCTTP
ncbi:MAG TPA: discoidin domain-containing protein [Polyangia bacterium]